MALLIKADGAQEEVNGEASDGSLTYEQLRKAIGGGYIEIVACDPEVTKGYTNLVCDEEGKLKSFPINDKATKLSTYTAPTDLICGDVLFCKDGEIT